MSSIKVCWFNLFLSYGIRTPVTWICFFTKVVQFNHHTGFGCGKYSPQRKAPGEPHPAHRTPVRQRHHTRGALSPPAKHLPPKLCTNTTTSCHGTYIRLLALSLAAVHPCASAPRRQRGCTTHRTAFLAPKQAEAPRPRPSAKAIGSSSTKSVTRQTDVTECPKCHRKKEKPK